MFGKRSLPRPSPGTVFGALALMVATTGVAVAAIPGSNGVISTCFNKSHGTWRPVDVQAGAKCKAGEVMLDLYSKSGADAAFLARTGKAADSDKLDGLDSTAFLGASGEAADSDKLDGLDSTAFLGASDRAADSDKLDGLDSTAFLGASGKAADSDKLDGQDSTDFIAASRLVSVSQPRAGQVIFLPGQTHEVVTLECPDQGVAVRGNFNRPNEQYGVDEQYGRSTYTVRLTNNASAIQFSSFAGALECMVAPRPPLP